MSRTGVSENAPRSGTSLDLTGFAGLTDEDARRNIAEDGPNEIASQEKRELFAIVLEVVREPMFLMLVAAGLLYLLMGSAGDALMLLGFVFVVMAITIVQERRTERALDALRDSHEPDAARALTFLTLVVSVLVIILANRSWRRGIVSMLRVPNSALWWVVGGAAAFLAVVLLVPAAQSLFHFAPLHATDTALSFGAGLACVMWFELLKLSKWRIRAPTSPPSKNASGVSQQPASPLYR